MITFLTLLLVAQSGSSAPAPISPAQDQDQAQALTVTLPDWLDLSASLRLRMESTFDQPNGEDRHRGRVRFRVGAKAQVAPGMRAEVRMSTASGSANNPHWDLGGDDNGETLGGANLRLDRINLAWQTSEELLLKAGKLGNPLASNPIYGEWLWDADIQPSGLAAHWKAGQGVDVRAGYFVVDENNAPSSDPAVAALQFNLKSQASEVHWDLHSTLWDWSLGSTAGDYLVWDNVLSGRVDDWKASLQYFQNLDDETDEDTGVALGLQFGKGGEPGLYQYFVSVYDFEANASVWGVSGDDVPLAVGRDGFVGGLKYWWHDNTTVKLWALQGDDGTDDPLRVRFDIDVSF